MTIDEPKPNSEKSQKIIVKKQSTHAKKTTSTINSLERTLSYEFEEQSVAGKKDNHRYSITFSDLHNIRKLIQTKKLSIKDMQPKIHSTFVKTASDNP